MYALIGIASLTLIYWALSECLRRCKLQALLIVFGAVPLLLAPIWAWTTGQDLFLWFKLSSVFGGICCAGCLRFTHAGRFAELRKIVPWILIINVGEAMLVDLLQTGIAHKLNAAAAVMLMLSIPFSRAAVRVEECSVHRDLQFDLPRTWIAGYTLWNWSFVLVNYPAHAGHHMAILLAAFLVGCINPRIWLQARAATLGVTLLVYATNPNALLAILDTSHWSSSYAYFLAPAVACLWVICFVRTHGARNKTTQGTSVRCGTLIRSSSRKILYT